MARKNNTEKPAEPLHIPGTGYLREVERLESEETRSRVEEGLYRLQQQFDKAETDGKRTGVPRRTLESTLLLATWNIRALTEDVREEGEDKGRLPECYIYMAAILRRFDLIAIQEVQDVAPLRKVTALMGPWWKYMITDVTDGKLGNNERLAFVYDSRKVEFDGLVGEVVLPSQDFCVLDEDVLLTLSAALNRQKDEFDDKDFPATKFKTLKTEMPDKNEPVDRKLFTKNFDRLFPKPKAKRAAKTDKGGAKRKPKRKTTDRTRFRDLVLKHATTTVARQISRTPFLCGFKSGWVQFQLCTVHIYFGQGKSDKQRVKEVEVLASILEERCQSEKTNVVLLGDMNIFAAGKKKDDGAMQALEHHGFKMPDGIKRADSNTDDRATRQPFDQIAVCNSGGLFYVTEKCGVFDFFQSVFRKDQLNSYKNELKLLKKLPIDKVTRHGDAVEKDEKKHTALEKRYYHRRTFQMSDHLIKWVEIATDYTAAVLDGAEKMKQHQNKQLPTLELKPPTTDVVPVSKAANSKSVQVEFHNQRTIDVELLLLNSEGGPKAESKILERASDRPVNVDTWPNAVWEIAIPGGDRKRRKRLGYFVVEDDCPKYKAVVPFDNKKDGRNKTPRPLELRPRKPAPDRVSKAADSKSVQVEFHNRRKIDVELLLLNEDEGAQAEPQRLEGGSDRPVKVATWPNAVWEIAIPGVGRKRRKTLGYFVVEDDWPKYKAVVPVDIK